MNKEFVTSTEQSVRFIITTHAEFLDTALQEIQRIDRRIHCEEIIAPGIVLCRVPDERKFLRTVVDTRPIFIRHLAPVQAIIELENTEKDLQNIAITLAELPTFAMLERGQHFAVQTRMAQSEEGGIKRAYSGGQINQLLAEAIIEETGAVEAIKRPQIVVSLLFTQQQIYIGISLTRDNLSAWPGGMRHFAQTPEQISRAEFKLLEGLETFGLELPDKGRALDLGAAPGGWARLLLAAGLKVVAVDPARLDVRLDKQSNLLHYRGYAEQYLEEALQRKQLFDVITNDMRMDAREAARLLIQAGDCLKHDGFIFSTLKLPHATSSIDPLKNMREATGLLKRHFEVVQARQLFHNRQEVTIVAARPHSTRL